MGLVNPLDIVAIHDRVIHETGGGLGVREPGLLIAVAEKPAASFAGKDLYPTIYLKAGALFEAICNYHVFVDGNKRTSIVVLEYFLHLHNLQLSAPQQVKEDFVLWTATTNPDLDQVAEWIQNHVIDKPTGPQ
jgi:death-on-curing protein